MKTASFWLHVYVSHDEKLCVAFLFQICTTAGTGCTHAAGNEVRAREASVYGLSVPTPHVTSLSSH